MNEQVKWFLMKQYARTSMPENFATRHNRILGFTSRNMLLMGILITLALLIEKREIIGTLF